MPVFAVCTIIYLICVLDYPNYDTFQIILWSRGERFLITGFFRDISLPVIHIGIYYKYGYVINPVP